MFSSWPHGVDNFVFAPKRGGVYPWMTVNVPQSFDLCLLPADNGSFSRKSVVSIASIYYPDDVQANP